MTLSNPTLAPDIKRIAVDMDGVLADVYKQFSRLHEDEFGEIISVNDMTGRPEGVAFPHARKYVTTAGFFREAPVIEDSQRIMALLNDRYEVFIVSSAMEFPLSLAEKQSWLNEHFPFISWQQMVFCGSKEIIRADIMIDDHFKNLDHFPGETFLFTQPHNQLAESGRHKRVSSWNEIAKWLIAD